MTYAEEIAGIQRRIRDLEIQGARNVAIWGLRCLELAVKHAPASTPSQLIDTMGKIAREVSLIRVTEPMLRNVLATVLYEAKKAPPEKVEDLRSMTLKLCSGLLDDLESSLSEIQRQGARVIKDGDTIFTHCHSSSVTKLIVSQSREKDIRVLCTETRPRWQGRKTARELAEVMAAVGLAQNLAALRALATEGIQRGHMKLHARNIAISVGAKGELVDLVVQRMVEEGVIRMDRAKEILEELLRARGQSS